jgi:predicted Zn-dependent peptidase
MYKNTALKNGLRVATEQLPGMESVTVAVTVDVGARFETEDQGGLSHLLEHMAFKGTKRRNARQIAEEMDMVGGNMNAYTSLENTVYYVRVLKEDVPLAVDMLADIMQNSMFDEEELGRERQVILQEIAMHYDTPDDLIFDDFTETAYPGQPLGRSILGKAERVATFSRDDLTGYMGAHYHTPHMIVSAAGNIDHDAFLKLAGDHFGSLPGSRHEKAQRGKYVGGEKRTKRKLEQLHLMLGFEAVSIHDPDYYTWQVLATLLGGGMSSRLFQEVREKRGLAYTVQAFTSSFEDSGILGIYAATAENKGPEMLPVVCDEVLKLQDGVNEQELQRAKNQIKASLLMTRESSSGIAEWIGRHLLSHGRYKPASEIVALIDAISAADIARISKAITRSTPTLAILGPQKGLPKFDDVKKQLAA